MSLLDQIRWRRAGKNHDTPSRTRPRRRVAYVPAHHTPPRKQRVVVKVSYSKTGKLSGHQKYIARDGAGRDGSRPELFDEHGICTVSDKALKNEKRFFKFIISPEHGVELSLKDYTREVMESVSTATMYSLQWYAADHYNTDKPHVHVVVRGVAKDGREVRLDPEFIKTGIREYAELIATKHLGLRSGQEIEAQKKSDTVASRFTQVDRQIKMLSRKREADQSIEVCPETSFQQDRLAYLVSIGMARPSHSLRTFSLDENWEEQLRAMGMANDKQKMVGLAVKNSPISSRSVPGSKDHRIWNPGIGPVSGKIVYKDYIEQDFSDIQYLVVETDSAYYLVEGEAATTSVEVGGDITVGFIEPAASVGNSSSRSISNRSSGRNDNSRSNSGHSR
jgi:type IV secretory pathway VirD2 relaxase